MRRPHSSLVQLGTSRGWVRLARAMALLLLGLVITIVLYLALGYFALGLMFEKYGGSGHPPLPSAPNAVYRIVFVIVLPIASLTIGALSVGGLVRIVRRRRRRPG